MLVLVFQVPYFLPVTSARIYRHNRAFLPDCLTCSAASYAVLHFSCSPWLAGCVTILETTLPYWVCNL